MKHYEERVQKEILDGAALYALSDKSDPFAYSRAISHINNGVAGYDRQRSKPDYFAERQSEERVLPNGEKYMVPVYKNASHA